MKTFFKIQSLLTIAILISLLVAIITNATLASCAFPIVMLIGLIVSRFVPSTTPRTIS